MPSPALPRCLTSPNTSHLHPSYLSPLSCRALTKRFEHDLLPPSPPCSSHCFTFPLSHSSTLPPPPLPITAMQSTDKRFEHVDNMWHIVVKEPGNRDVLKTIIAWLEERRG